MAVRRPKLPATITNAVRAANGTEAIRIVLELEFETQGIGKTSVIEALATCVNQLDLILGIEQNACASGGDGSFNEHSWTKLRDKVRAMETGLNALYPKWRQHIRNFSSPEK